jgi:hypothetical protein
VSVTHSASAILHVLISADFSVGRPPGHVAQQRSLQITRFGTTPGSRLGDQISGHIGGTMRGRELVEHRSHYVITNRMPYRVAVRHVSAGPLRRRAPCPAGSMRDTGLAGT